ncbi:hypothetical protein A2U01_0090802, partial [Trifolium medium]|nr:hypothetical protein [Trifolium medium]
MVQRSDRLVHGSPGQTGRFTVNPDGQSGSTVRQPVHVHRVRPAGSRFIRQTI